jgi:hypothetical protein
MSILPRIYFVSFALTTARGGFAQEVEASAQRASA